MELGKRKLRILCASVVLLTIFRAQACINDGITLSTERSRHPDLAKVILGEKAQADDPALLKARIKNLTENRREDDPTWWNDLAGA